jgi:hypothetical protein
MKIKTLAILCAVIALRLSAQTNHILLTDEQVGIVKINQTFIPATSPTLKDFRVRFPAYSNVDDCKMVLGIARKFPELIEKDKAFADEFYRYSAQFTGRRIATPTNQTTITTLAGSVYNNIVIQKVQPDGLIVSCSGNGIFIGKLDFEDLPQKFKDYYGYDKKWASDFEKMQLQANVDVTARLIENDQIAKEAAYHRAVAEYEAEKEAFQNLLKIQAVQAQQDAAYAAQEQAWESKRMADALDDMSFQMEMQNIRTHF